MESLLCASAVALSGISCFGTALQAQALEETVGYMEKEIGASSNISFDAPEEIPINTLCEGEVGGENPTGDGGTWTDYFDRYQVEIPQEDFTATKRGRFHLEFSTVADSAQAFDIEVSPKDEYADDYYSETVSGKTVTPDYSYYGPVEIRISPKNTSIHHKYRFKIVYEILENDETGQWAETELNTSEGNAAQLELNQDYWGCLQGSLGSHTLWYQYTLDRPGKVNVAIKPQDGKKPITEDLWRLAVHDGEDGSTEYLSGQNASGVVSDTVMMDPGTYLIEVYTFADFAVGQIYDLRVNYKELSSENTATPTPEPEATPEATGDPKESAAPAVTGTPTPEATGTPEETGAPEASAIPAVTGTPTPEATGTPDATGTPEETGAPEASAIPDATGTPTPEATPETTGDPEASAIPDVPGTLAPEAPPEASAIPVVTATPNPAGSSKATDQPVTLIKEEGTTTVEKTIKEITNTRVIQVTMKVSSKKKVALKWKKNKVAQGYQIYRSTKKGKGFKCVKVIKNRNTTKWKDTKVKKGKTYYYKLRAYKKVGKKTYYSKYTKILKIRAK